MQWGPTAVGGWVVGPVDFFFCMRGCMLEVLEMPLEFVGLVEWVFLWDTVRVGIEFYNNGQNGN